MAHDLEKKWRSKDVQISEEADFSTFLLGDRVLSGLTKAGFKRPSPIQLNAIPIGRFGKDLLVQAKSGTGKTLVFAIIALEMLKRKLFRPQVLILVPTREIATQICSVIESIGTCFKKLTCSSFIGGLSVKEDIEKAHNCQIAVGTPGRIKQLITMKALPTNSIRLVVFDEADQLVTFFMKQDIDDIFNSLPTDKQVIATSATYPTKLQNLMLQYLRDPYVARISVRELALLGITHYAKIVECSPMPVLLYKFKLQALELILKNIKFAQCLVFCNGINRVETLYRDVKNWGFSTTYISSAKEQTDRLKAIDRLKRFKCKVLVSSDVTSRGIDAENVDLVVNFDLSPSTEIYLHRAGRAGRYGSKGAAVTIIDKSEMKCLQKIEKEASFKCYKLPEPVPPNLIRYPVFGEYVIQSSEEQEKSVVHKKIRTKRVVKSGEDVLENINSEPDEIHSKCLPINSYDNENTPEEQNDDEAIPLNTSNGINSSFSVNEINEIMTKYEECLQNGESSINGNVEDNSIDKNTIDSNESLARKSECISQNGISNYLDSNDESVSKNEDVFEGTENSLTETSEKKSISSGIVKDLTFKKSNYYNKIFKIFQNNVCDSNKSKIQESLDEAETISVQNKVEEICSNDIISMENSLGNLQFESNDVLGLSHVEQSSVEATICINQSELEQSVRSIDKNTINSIDKNTINSIDKNTIDSAESLTRKSECISQNEISNYLDSNVESDVNLNVGSDSKRSEVSTVTPDSGKLIPDAIKEYKKSGVSYDTHANKFCPGGSNGKPSDVSAKEISTTVENQNVESYIKDSDLSGKCANDAELNNISGRGEISHAIANFVQKYDSKNMSLSESPVSKNVDVFEGTENSLTETSGKKSISSGIIKDITFKKSNYYNKIFKVFQNNVCDSNKNKIQESLDETETITVQNEVEEICSNDIISMENSLGNLQFESNDVLGLSHEEQSSVEATICINQSELENIQEYTEKPIPENISEFTEQPSIDNIADFGNPSHESSPFLSFGSCKYKVTPLFNITEHAQTEKSLDEILENSDVESELDNSLSDVKADSDAVHHSSKDLDSSSESSDSSFLSSDSFSSNISKDEMFGDFVENFCDKISFASNLETSSSDTRSDQKFLQGCKSKLTKAKNYKYSETSCSSGHSKTCRESHYFRHSKVYHQPHHSRSFNNCPHLDQYGLYVYPNAHHCNCPNFHQQPHHSSCAKRDTRRRKHKAVKQNAFQGPNHVGYAPGLHSSSCFMPSQHRCHPYINSCCNQMSVCAQWYQIFYNQWLHIQRCSGSMY